MQRFGGEWLNWGNEWLEVGGLVVWAMAARRRAGAMLPLRRLRL
jgi:hypothetical protein